MGLIIGAGASRPISPSQLLGIGVFNPDKAYGVGDPVLYGGSLYRFKTAHTVGTTWDETEVKSISTLDLILASIGDPRIKPLSSNIKEGDMLFYDRARQEYCYVAKAAIGAVLLDYNTTRYETNYDTYVGTLDGKAHFVALDDAYSQTGMYQSDAASTSCYYRIEIDNTQNGSITLSAASGNASVATTTITWSAGDTMTSIVSKFTAKNASYITFAALADGTGVGLNIGGYGANTLTYSDLTACEVIDCSALAFLRSLNPAAPAVSGTINPSAACTYLRPNTHNNFRGAAASSIITGKDLIGASDTLIAVNGYNYSYRCGVNFAKWKEWATTNGESTYYDDGEDGQSGSGHVANPGAHVMNKATFQSGVENYTGSDVQHLGMKDYYTHLFSDQTGDFATLRQSYEAMYGSMTEMYDAYMMSHMVDPGANTGITANIRNKGFNQTAVKADVMNVTYDYTVIPAYPPEYNAQHYGISYSEGFAPSVYYHPEPADLGLMFRDDNMALINDNVTEVRAALLQTVGTPLANTMYRGSCADCDSVSSWFFYGTYGCVTNGSRYNGVFRCRPSLALALPS